MALQVWLPLTGHTRNLGVSGNSFSENGVVTATDGVIGQTVEFDGTTTRVWTSEFNLENTWSICVWYYTETTASATKYILTLNIDNGFPTQQLTLALYNNANTIIVNGESYIIPSPTIVLDTWTHVAATFDGSELRTYINGEFVQSFSVTASLLRRTNLTIGARSADTAGAGGSASHFFDGKLNDIRVYDEVISAKEIKEISKALLLHLPLNQYRMDNLISSVSTGSTNTSIYENGILINIDGDNNINSYFRIYVSEAVNITDTYTLSFDVEGLQADGSFTFGIGSESGSVISLTNGRNVHSFTFDTAVAANGYFQLVDILRPSHGRFKFTNFALALGEHPDALFVPKEFNNDAVEYDCSGYGHNGTIVDYANTVPVVVYDSPRNERCYLFDTINKFILINDLDLSGIANHYTFAWWAKVPNINSKMMWGFVDGNRFNIYFSNNGYIYLNTGNGHGNPFVTEDGSNAYVGDYFDAWHHWAFTGDGTTATVYIDGEQFATATTYVRPTGTKLSISGWGAANTTSSATQYRWPGMELSDLRVYGTCLAQTDVKELYNAPVSFSDKGAVMTIGEFKE